MKICFKCGEEKDEEDFSLRKADGESRQAWCKLCAAEYLKEYHRRADVKFDAAQREQNKQDLYESRKPK